MTKIFQECLKNFTSAINTIHFHHGPNCEILKTLIFNSHVFLKGLIVGLVMKLSHKTFPKHLVSLSVTVFLYRYF